MRYFLVLGFVVLGVINADAKDVVLQLNEQEVTALHNVLDVATKAQGIQIAPFTVYLMNKLNAAPTVVDTKPEQGSDKDKTQ